MNHVIEPTQLQIGDHIYRQLDLWKFDVCFLQHHGIVTEVPKVNSNKTNIKVLEMTKHADYSGLKESTLEEFLRGRKLRIVKYGVSYLYQKTHFIPGTCHTEPKSDPKKIIRRCNELKSIFAGLNNTYSLFGLNCEHFALFCATGIMHNGIKNTQLLALLRKAEDGAHAAHKIRAVGRTTHIIHAPCAPRPCDTTGHVVSKSSTKSSAKITANVSRAHVYHSHSIFKPVPTGVAGVFIGIAAGMELCSSAYKIYKYKYDPTYFKDDLKWDLIKGWTMTGSIIGVGLMGISLSIGWWIIFPLVFSTGAVYGILHLVHKKKSYKEKCYIDRGLKLDSSISDKQKEIRIIEREIEQLTQDLRVMNEVSKTKKKYNITCIEMTVLKSFDVQRKAKYISDDDKDANIVDSFRVWWNKQRTFAKVIWLMNVTEFLQEDITEKLAVDYAVFNSVNVSVDVQQTTIEMQCLNYEYSDVVNAQRIFQQTAVEMSFLKHFLIKAE